MHSVPRLFHKRTAIVLSRSWLIFQFTTLIIVSLESNTDWPRSIYQQEGVKICEPKKEKLRLEVFKLLPVRAHNNRYKHKDVHRRVHNEEKLVKSVSLIDF